MAVRKVLVIYTGGTFGMKKTEHGYEPAYGYLFDLLARDPGFNRVDGGDGEQTLDVARPDGIHALPALFLPPANLAGEVVYTVLEYETLLDSSSIRWDHWLKMARTIERNYRLFDGFVVIHGTDSMAYSCSMLSFLLEDLGKSVVVTGSQIPISQLRNDARENLLGALLLAGNFVIPEVGLFFHHELLRGNRCSKVDAVGFDAFRSPNCLPLATVGVDLLVHWGRIHRPSPKSAPLKVRGDLPEVDVASLHVFPGIKASTIRALTSSSSLRGLVLHTFGAGNVPDDKELHSALSEASTAGLVLVNITQCLRGGVAPLYAAGEVLRRSGVESGLDMTAECALTKLVYLLARYPDDPAKVKKLVGRNLRGELSEDVHGVQHYSHAEAEDADRWATHSTDEDEDEDEVQSTQTSRYEDETLPDKDRRRRDRRPRRRPIRHRLADVFEAVSRDDVARMDRALGIRSGQQHQHQHHTHTDTDASAHGDQDLVNAADVDARTPLRYAAERGSDKCMARLLELGAFVHVKDAAGETALSVARKRGHAECESLLRRAGAH
ncbi:hypothetical protein PYCC9005_005845 [Savitreella phatthalungensis]